MFLGEGDANSCAVLHARNNSQFGVEQLFFKAQSAARINEELVDIYNLVRLVD